MRRIKHLLSYLILTLGAVMMAFPFFWMISTSLKTRQETISTQPTLWPEDAQWSNYVVAWKEAGTGSGESNFARYFLNSLFVALCVTAGVLFTSILAGYAFANMDFPGKKAIFLLFLSTMMIPFEVVLVPNFHTVSSLGWYDRYPALIVPWLANVFSIFILRQFFKSVPRDFYDAAQIDGCGHWRYLWHVAVPSVMPGIVTVTLFTFLGSWNAFLWPLLVTDSPELRVVQVGLSVLTGEESTNYNILMAASAIVIAPVIVLYFALQRKFIEGVSGAGIKG
ncbi:MAG: carbohydrate ABC transporter permease [Candidatus Sumerlaeota bacterium]